MANGLFGTGTAPDNNIDQVRIAPAGLPGSTYITPQRREVGTNLERLARSLGTLNGALSQYAQVSGQEDKDPNSEANRAFLDSIQGLSMEEVAQKYPEARNRIQKDGALALVGSKAASEFRNDVADWYNTEFDQNTGNFQAEVEAKRQEYAKGLGDPAMQAAFFRETETFVQKFLEQDTERRVTGAVEERNTAVVDHFRNMVDDGLAKKLTPQQIAATVLKESSLSRDFYAMDGEAQNQTLYNIAVEYAGKGQTELVRALVDTDRVGSDGKKIGALSRTSKYAAKAADLIKSAMTEEAQVTLKGSADTQFQIDNLKRTGELDEKTAKDFMAKHPWYTADAAAADVNASKTNKEQILAGRAKEEGRLRSIASSQETKARIDAQVYSKGQGMGGLDDLEDIEVPNEAGTGTEVYSADKQKKNFVRRLASELDEFKQNLIDSGASPEEADRQTTIRTVNEFTKVKAEHPTWSKEFGGIAISTPVLRAAEKGEVADHIIEKVEKYNQISAINPAYADSLLANDKDREFYDRYVDARQYGRLSPQAALLEASRGTHDSVKNKVTTSPSKKDLDDATDDVLGDLSETVEASYADREVVSTRIARYMRNGMDKNKAKEKATKEIEDNSFTVNGRLVMDDQSLPQDAPVLFEKLLQTRFEVFGKKYGIEDPEDLYIVPSGPGVWTVVSKDLGGLPIGDGSVITTKELGTERRRLNNAEASRLETMRSGKAAEKAKAMAEHKAELDWRKKKVSALRKRKGALSLRLADFLEKQWDTREKEASGFFEDPSMASPEVLVPTP